MIKTQREYDDARKQLAEYDMLVAQQRAHLEGLGLTATEVDRGMAPLLSFKAQVEEDIAWYDRVRRRQFDPRGTLADIKRLLIALRIANNLTQNELAERLGVTQSQISRWERNDYYGITIETAERIAAAMGEEFTTSLAERAHGSSPAAAS